jgi:Tol biopolymer transport system component
VLAAAAAAALGTVGAAAETPPHRIAFASLRDVKSDRPWEAPNSLYVMNPDGSGIRRVLRLPGSRFGESSWAPDRRRLAVEVEQLTWPPMTRLAIVDVDSGSLRWLLQGAPLRDDVEPSWSKQGDVIAFSSTRGKNSGYRIFVVRPDGTGLRRLTNGSFDRDPAWSPDGSRIVFTGDGLTIVRRDGSDRRLLVWGGALSDPAWSPNGRTIAYTRTVPSGSTDVWTVRPATGTKRRRTRTETLSESSPTWSPDGRSLAYQFRSYRQASLWTMRLDGSGARPVTEPVGDQLPTWRD